MFHITEDPSSGSLIKCLAKITKMILSCPLTWTWLVLRQRIVTCCTRTICRRNTDYVHVNGHDRTSLVILARHFIRLPDGGSSVIRNMLEHFFNSIYTNYIFVH